MWERRANRSLRDFRWIPVSRFSAPGGYGERHYHNTLLKILALQDELAVSLFSVETSQ